MLTKNGALVVPNVNSGDVMDSGQERHKLRAHFATIAHTAANCSTAAAIYIIGSRYRVWWPTLHHDLAQKRQQDCGLCALRQQAPPNALRFREERAVGDGEVTIYFDLQGPFRAQHDDPNDAGADDNFSGADDPDEKEPRGSNKIWLFTAINDATGEVAIRPIQSPSDKKVGNAIKNVCKSWGNPVVHCWRSDNGFGHEVTALLKRYGGTYRTGTAENPQSQERIERTHKTIMAALQRARFLGDLDDPSMHNWLATCLAIEGQSRSGEVARGCGFSVSDTANAATMANAATAAGLREETALNRQLTTTDHGAKDSEKRIRIGDHVLRSHPLAKQNAKINLSFRNAERILQVSDVGDHGGVTPQPLPGGPPVRFSQPTGAGRVVRVPRAWAQQAVSSWVENGEEGGLLS